MRTHSRVAHQLGLVLDRDALASAAVALLACVASGGLVYLGYLAHVLCVALRAPVAPPLARCVLLFGKHAPRGRLDADFDARLQRAATLLGLGRTELLVLLGGGPAGAPTEAELAHRGLRALGIDDDAPLLLEAASRDTMQNLRNARDLIAASPLAGTRVTLLSSRYHLARCAWLARQLGLEVELCAAEARLPLGPRRLLRIALEAGYVCWLDLGTRWARMTGNVRRLQRVS